jgi:hypothetical protein
LLKEKLTVDQLIRETGKCRKSLSIHLRAGFALRLIAEYKPKDFLKHLKNFKKDLEAPNWEDEELRLLLRIDNITIEFSRCRSTR